MGIGFTVSTVGANWVTDARQVVYCRAKALMRASLAWTVSSIRGQTTISQLHEISLDCGHGNQQ